MIHYGLKLFMNVISKYDTDLSHANSMLRTVGLADAKNPGNNSPESFYDRISV